MNAAGQQVIDALLQKRAHIQKQIAYWKQTRDDWNSKRYILPNGRQSVSLAYVDSHAHLAAMHYNQWKTELERNTADLKAVGYYFPKE